MGRRQPFLDRDNARPTLTVGHHNERLPDRLDYLWLMLRRCLPVLDFSGGIEDPGADLVKAFAIKLALVLEAVQHVTELHRPADAGEAGDADTDFSAIEFG